jgi:hypothetical protein
MVESPHLRLVGVMMSRLHQPSRHNAATVVQRVLARERSVLLAMIGLCSVLAGWMAPANGLVALLLLGVAVAGAARYMSADGG